MTGTAVAVAGRGVRPGAVPLIGKTEPFEQVEINRKSCREIRSCFGKDYVGVKPGPIVEIAVAQTTHDALDTMSIGVVSPGIGRAKIHKERTGAFARIGKPALPGQGLIQILVANQR